MRCPVPWGYDHSYRDGTIYALDDNIVRQEDGSFTTDLYLISKDTYKKHLPVRIINSGSSEAQLDIEDLRKRDARVANEIEVRDYNTIYIKDLLAVGACVARGIPIDTFYEKKPPEDLKAAFADVALGREGVHCLPIYCPEIDQMVYAHFVKGYPVAVTEDIRGKNELWLLPGERLHGICALYDPQMWSNFARGQNSFVPVCELEAGEKGYISALRDVSVFFVRKTKENLVKIQDDYSLKRLGFSLSSDHSFVKGYTVDECAKIAAKVTAQKRNEPDAEDKFWTPGASFKHTIPYVPFRPMRYINLGALPERKQSEQVQIMKRGLHG